MECRTKRTINLRMFMRYALVGIVATCIFYALSNLCAIFLSVFVATFLGNVGSFVFGYFAQMRFAFRTNANHKAMIPRYIVLLCTIFAYGQVCAILGEFCKMPYFITSAFIALTVPLFSYPAQKFWVFVK